MDPTASVANKRLTAKLNSLDATLTKNRGVGVLLLTKSCPEFLSCPLPNFEGSGFLRRGHPAHFSKKLPHPHILFSYNPRGYG